jgi:mono/diheme cytochrome c family protein
MISRLLLSLLGAGLLLASGCKPLFDIRKAMYDQPKYEPLEKTDFFGDSRSARPLVEGTVPQGHLRLNDHLYQGIELIDGEYRQAQTFPFEITLDDLNRGQEVYNIHCSVCHGTSGNGNGMVVQRGYKYAPSYHQERLRLAPPGYFYNVIMNGYGQMMSYSHQIKVEDRWRLIAYIKTLQRSQFAKVEDLEAVEALQPADSAEPASSDQTHEHH